MTPFFHPTARGKYSQNSDLLTGIGPRTNLRSNLRAETFAKYSPYTIRSSLGQKSHNSRTKPNQGNIWRVFGNFLQSAVESERRIVESLSLAQNEAEDTAFKVALVWTSLSGFEKMANNENTSEIDARGFGFDFVLGGPPTLTQSRLETHLSYLSPPLSEKSSLPGLFRMILHSACAGNSINARNTGWKYRVFLIAAKYREVGVG